MSLIIEFGSYDYVIPVSLNITTTPHPNLINGISPVVDSGSKTRNRGERVPFV